MVVFEPAPLLPCADREIRRVRPDLFSHVFSCRAAHTFAEPYSVCCQGADVNRRADISEEMMKTLPPVKRTSVSWFVPWRLEGLEGGSSKLGARWSGGAAVSMFLPSSRAKVAAACAEPSLHLVGDMTVFNYVWKAGLDLGIVPGTS